MDIYKLSSTTLLPEELVRNLESIHWVDSFSDAGEFTIQTPDIKTVMKQIPPGTFLGNNLDNSMMIVDKFSIRTDEKGIPKLTIKGRTAETFLENRFLVDSIQNGVDDDSLTFYNKYPGELIVSLVTQGRIDASEWGFGYTVAFPFRFMNDIKHGPVIDAYNVPRGSVYAAAHDLAMSYGVAFHLRRPYKLDDSPALLDSRPGRVRTNNANPMFAYFRGDITNEQYDWDITQYANNVYAFSKLAAKGYGETRYRGDYVHRMKMIDIPDTEPKDMIKANEIEIYDLPIPILRDILSAVKTVHEKVNDLQVLKYQYKISQQRANQYYNLAQETKRYTFEVSPNSKAKYQKDYDLGDIVTVRSSWDDNVDMRVDSYVRSFDESGYIEYPELVEYNPLKDLVERS